MDYGVDDGVIVISTGEELASHPQLRSFNVSDLLPAQGAAESLQKVIASNVDKSVIISIYQDRLVVKGTTAQILEVENVLNELRRKR